MPFHAPNSSVASAKLLRAFAAGSGPAPPADVFAVAKGETADPVLTGLISQLTSATAIEQVDDALQAVFNLSNALPPGLLAPHWRTFCQKVLAICKQNITQKTLATLSALIVSSIPLSTLGSEQRAVVAGIAKQCLQNASFSLSVHPREALGLVLAVIHAAPRELRAQSFDDRLYELLAHPSRDVRILTARVLTEVLKCVPEKQQQNLFTQRVLYVNQQVGDILSLLDAFTGGKYAGGFADKTTRQVSDHVDGLCRVMVNLLDLPMRAVLPLEEVLKTFCDGVRERVIDPYAVVSGIKVTHDEMFTIIPHVQCLSAQMVADITQRVHKLALQRFVKDIGKVFEMRLSKLLLRSREEDGLVCVSERGELYKAIGKLITNLGTAFLQFVAPRFQELFDIDVTLYRKCLAGEQMLRVDPVDNIQSGGRSRKRKRQNGRRDASMGGHVLTKDSVQGLTSIYGKQTTVFVERTICSAFDVVTRIFDCRGLLTKGVARHLDRIEVILFEFLEEKRLSPMLLQAMASAALGGGSKRMAGKASLLLMPLVTVCTAAALDPKFPPETRDAALVARAGCEAIIHPSGPPYLQESKMYPNIVESERSGKERLSTRKDQTEPAEKASKQNRTLPNENNTESGKLSSDVVEAESSEMLPNKKSTEDFEKTDNKGSPANDMMEVEETNAIQPVAIMQQEKHAGESISIRNGNAEAPEEVKEFKKTPYTGSIPAPETAQTDLELPEAEKISDEEVLSGYSNPEPESIRAQGTGILENEGNMKPSQQVNETTEVEQEECDFTKEQKKAQSDLEGGDSEGDDDEQDLEKEDQALIASLVFDPPDEE